MDPTSMSILISITAKILQPVLILIFWSREKKIKNSNVYWR